MRASKYNRGMDNVWADACPNKVPKFRTGSLGTLGTEN